MRSVTYRAAARRHHDARRRVRSASTHRIQRLVTNVEQSFVIVVVVTASKRHRHCSTLDFDYAGKIEKSRTKECRIYPLDIIELHIYNRDEHQTQTNLTSDCLSSICVESHKHTARRKTLHTKSSSVNNIHYPGVFIIALWKDSIFEQRTIHRCDECFLLSAGTARHHVVRQHTNRSCIWIQEITENWLALIIILLRHDDRIRY